MFAVAIPRFAGDPEAVARRLQQTSGLTLYEERKRIGRSFPRVVTTCADREAADRERAALAEAGVRAVVIDCDAIERDGDRQTVRRFELTGDALRAEVRGGDQVVLPYADITALIRGVEIHQTSTTVTTKKRKLSAGRALATGGLMTHKKVKKSVTTHSEQRGAYLFVYAPDRPTLAMREKTLVFSGLGDAMDASNTVNFARLIDELRRRAPQAAYDERLHTRAGQIAVLGRLDAERHGDLAVALVSYVCWLESSGQ